MISGDCDRYAGYTNTLSSKITEPVAIARIDNRIASIPEFTPNIRPPTRESADIVIDVTRNPAATIIFRIAVVGATKKKNSKTRNNGISAWGRMPNAKDSVIRTKHATRAPSTRHESANRFCIDKY